MNTTYFIEPLDVLFLRGNKLFGDAGSFGASLVPPWPSVAAGALRSALLAYKGHDFARFASGDIEDPELGTPQRPGPFRVTAFQLARRHPGPRIEALFALPADMVIVERPGGAPDIRYMTPWSPANGIVSSAATEQLAVLPETERGKPETDRWLTSEGWSHHLKGLPIIPERHLLRTSELWKLDVRVGVGLDPEQHRAADGQLFTVQGVAPKKAEHDADQPWDVGFLSQVDGAQLPEVLTLRFGGDGRGALATRADIKLPEPDYDAIVKAGRCRLILLTPGVFPGGWHFAVNDEGRFEFEGVKGRLVCAAVNRADIISGYDMAKKQPKNAERVAPTGSVYWLDKLEATASELRKLADAGLWLDSNENTARQAEGFNRFTWAVWA